MDHYAPDSWHDFFLAAAGAAAANAWVLLMGVADEEIEEEAH
jgi:hypothetical protein